MTHEPAKHNGFSQKERVRRRIHTQIDQENYTFFPAKEPRDFFGESSRLSVAVYARVSTGNVEQTSSYELQKKYYEDYVRRHPNWTLARIYADEGISGTSLAHREQFHQMITDCKAGKIDLILTKSVSRFARNVVDCISTVRMLGELPSPVGVFFESECIFSLKEDSQMALSFQATMAQEESHTRSRSMETSLRMRLDGGLPLTPKLLGYSHDSEGNLVVNPKEAPTVKLIFYLYLYGYSTSEIAEILTRQRRKTYLGNLRWTSNTVVQVLRNERHCGDVLTRKTFTPNYLTHKAKKNKGDRPQSLYRNHHEAIVSREDFIAVQHLLDNAKYGNKSFLPELRVVDQGLLRGFVVLHPRWAGFQPEDYLQASAAVHAGEEEKGAAPSTWDGFERTRSQLFSDAQQASIVFQRNKVRLSALCVRDLGERNKVELLVDPLQKLLALRTAPSSSRNALTCSTLSNGVYHPREMGAAAYFSTLFTLLGWNIELKYRVSGIRYRGEGETAYLFRAKDGEAYFTPHSIEAGVPDGWEPLLRSGKQVRGIPAEWVSSFGDPFVPEEPAEKESWNMKEPGRLLETKETLHTTSREEMECYIRSMLGDAMGKEAWNG